ncbi:MAG: hypothetical protein JWR20_7, partial [Marmoricola sp.]|nr:hypothetical protein [Marmoricola sp.]
MHSGSVSVQTAPRQERGSDPTSDLPVSRHVRLRAPRDTRRWVWLVAGLTALLRLPFVGAPLSPDEGGFLLVAGAWHRGTSLYGDLWVDRPPLLLAIFRVADLLGGQAHALTVLRVLGCAVAGLTVAGVGLAARQLVGTRSGPVWAASVAGVLLLTPAGGGSVVNGEPLASPLVALGLLAALHASRPGPTAARWALLA